MFCWGGSYVAAGLSPRGTEIAWAETEEAAVKSELGWSWLWWTVWDSNSGLKFRSASLWSVPKAYWFFTLTLWMDSCSVRWYSWNFSASPPHTTAGLPLSWQTEDTFPDTSTNQRMITVSPQHTPAPAACSPYSVTLNINCLSWFSNPLPACSPLNYNLKFCVGESKY